VSWITKSYPLREISNNSCIELYSSSASGEDSMNSSSPAQKSNASQAVYLVLCVLGTVLPLWYFVPFLLHNGLNLPLFVHQLFANQISSFFAMDVLVSVITLWSFVRRDKDRPKGWISALPLVASLVVGGSLGWPLYLYLRDARKTE